jgi:RNA polymerase sigma factor (TIGR02999 family)
LTEITSLLRAAASGEDEAFQHLAPLVYSDLRRLARHHLRRLGHMTLLDTSGLVHEAWLKLQARDGLDFPDRKYFLGFASRVMRATAIDVARSRMAQKRGAGQLRLTLSTEAQDIACDADDVLRIHEALEELAQVDERLVRVVEMRYFGGLTESEIADALEVTVRTVQRDWRKARLVLLASLKG